MKTYSEFSGELEESVAMTVENAGLNALRQGFGDKGIALES